MESETVKPPKALPNTLRDVMPTVVVATKLSQGKKDLENPKYIVDRIGHALIMPDKFSKPCLLLIVIYYSYER